MTLTRNRDRRQRIDWEQQAAAAGIHVPIGADAGKLFAELFGPDVDDFQADGQGVGGDGNDEKGEDDVAYVFFLLVVILLLFYYFSLVKMLCDVTTTSLSFPSQQQKHS